MPPSEMLCACCAPGAEDPKDEVAAGATQAYATSSAAPAAAAVARSSGGAAPGSSAISFDLLLSDLESSEQIVYGEAFAQMDTAGAGSVPLDSIPLKVLVASNTSIDEAEIDTELLKVINFDEGGGCTLQNFLQVYRENAIATNVSIEEFLAASADGVVVSASDCRSRLLLLGQRKLEAQFNEDQWDRIFNTVMMDCDVVVNMEVWIAFCSKVARIVRLSKQARV